MRRVNSPGKCAAYNRTLRMCAATGSQVAGYQVMRRVGPHTSVALARAIDPKIWALGTVCSMGRQSSSIAALSIPPPADTRFGGFLSVKCDSPFRMILPRKGRGPSFATSCPCDGQRQVQPRRGRKERLLSAREPQAWGCDLHTPARRSHYRRYR